MAKNLDIGILNQIYGGLLTDNQREVAAFYYDDDLSLGEIAENLGVTRQAVHDTLNKAETALLSYEAKLGVYGRNRRILGAVKRLRPRTDPAGQADLDEIVNAL